MHNIPHASPKKSTQSRWMEILDVTALPEKPSSWTSIVDQQRIPSEKTDIQVAWEQIKDWCQSAKTRPLLLLDRGMFACGCVSAQYPGLDVLCRLRAIKFYKPAHPIRKEKGQPRKDGAKLKLDDLPHKNNPDRTYNVTDEKGHPVTMRCWEQMHAKKARWLDFTIIQVIRPQLPAKNAIPKISWFVYMDRSTEGIAHSYPIAYVWTRTWLSL